MKNYPYYIIPDIEALPDASGTERMALVRRIAAAVGDPVALRTLIGVDPQEFLSFYPDMESPELTTDDTINAFLEKFGSAPSRQSGQPQPSSCADDELDKLIQPVAVPYDLSSLEELPELPSSSPLIPENTINAESKEEDNPLEQASSLPPTQPQSLSESGQSQPSRQPQSLSESLARIMIKNGNYQKALEIINEISLNNPKKSVYFADQIRFLEKLIALKASPKTSDNSL